MFLRQFKESSMANMSYILADEQTRRAAVVDPVGDIQRILKALNAEGLKLDYVLITHGHPDHTSGAGTVAKETGAKIAAYKTSQTKKDVALEDGAVLKVGGIDVKVMHTPGHTRDSVCFLAGNKLFTGDTLFVGECGRTDMPGSDAAQMFHSLFDKLLRLPDDTEVYPGHDYGPKPTSTIGNEKKNNYVLQPRSIEEFLEFMAEP
jgi:hydroxyacylglutathione hydrolase